MMIGNEKCEATKKHGKIKWQILSRVTYCGSNLISFLLSMEDEQETKNYMEEMGVWYIMYT